MAAQSSERAHSNQLPLPSSTDQESDPCKHRYRSPRLLHFYTLISGRVRSLSTRKYIKHKRQIKIKQTFKPLALLMALRGRSTRRTRRILTTPIVSLLSHRQPCFHYCSSNSVTNEHRQIQQIKLRFRP